MLLAENELMNPMSKILYRKVTANTIFQETA